MPAKKPVSKTKNHRRLKTPVKVYKLAPAIEGIKHLTALPIKMADAMDLAHNRRQLQEALQVFQEKQQQLFKELGDGQKVPGDKIPELNLRLGEISAEEVRLDIIKLSIDIFPEKDSSGKDLTVPADAFTDTEFMFP